MTDKADKQISIREFIKKYDLSDETTVFILRLGARKTEEYLVKEIPKKLLGKKLTIVQPNRGGKAHKYGCYLLIYEK